MNWSATATYYNNRRATKHWHTRVCSLHCLVPTRKCLPIAGFEDGKYNPAMECDTQTNLAARPQP